MTTSQTAYFYHQLADRHFPDLLSPKPVEWPFTSSDEIVVGPSGRLFAYSHSFWELKTYDFWLQMYGADQWGDILRTYPYTQYDPEKHPHGGPEYSISNATGHMTAPRHATFSVNFQLEGLPPGVRIRAVTSHLEGKINRSKSGAWGLTMVTDSAS